MALPLLSCVALVQFVPDTQLSLKSSLKFTYLYLKNGDQILIFQGWYEDPMRQWVLSV